jgi:multicomponent Na+:H+ antiporter subunit F
MSTFEILLVIYAAILAAAALGVVYRMVVGPTILDRALSGDALVTLVVMGMALYAAHSRATWAGPALLGLTGLAFIGTVTFARFVAREDPMQGRRTRHSREPRTDTGPHEAIHPDPSSSEAWDQAPGGASDSTPGSTPGNTFVDAESQDPLTAEDPLEDPLQPGDEHGFGAQPGWRGFEDERRGVRDPGTTEEPR